MSNIEVTTTVGAVPRGDRDSTTILVVEDDLLLLEFIERLLRRRGFRTVGVTTGADALSWLEEHSPDLMLLDYSLPDMLGEELVAHLQSQGREVPFVVASGYDSETVAVEMMNRGARDYLVKGAAFAQLLPATIEKVLFGLAQEECLREAELYGFRVGCN